jgi:hypothetical protein
MTKWKHTIDISQDWKMAENGSITPQQISKNIAEKLRGLKVNDIFQQEEHEDIIDELECLSEDDMATFNDFDVVMSRLYDWADYEKTCWIKTF